MVLDKREGRAIIRVEHQVVKKLLDFFRGGVNRVELQVEEQTFFGWIGGRIRGELSLFVVGDCKVEDRAEEGFLVASHGEAVKECADLGVYRVSFRVEGMESGYIMPKTRPRRTPGGWALCGAGTCAG